MNTIYRKIAFLIPFLLLSAFYGYSQQGASDDAGVDISGAVLDADSLVFLGGATVKNISSNKVQLADKEGLYSIHVMPGDTLLFQHMTYRPSFYVVPIDLDSPQYALVQLLQKETSPQTENMRGFPTQLQFEQALINMDPGNLYTQQAGLQVHLERVTNDPTKMQKYIDDVMRYRQLYVLPERGQQNDLLNPDRWRNFIKDWREGRFTQEGMEKLDGFPARVKDFDEQ